LAGELEQAWVTRAMTRLRLGMAARPKSWIVGVALVGWMIATTGCARTAEHPSEGEGDRAEPMPSCPSGMVEIPSGSYLMGADDGDADEKPVHRVTVAQFCMDRTEVTVAMYAECVGRSLCPPAPTTADWPGIDDDAREFDSQFCNGGRSDRGDHPINCVDWNQADIYCRAVGKRLPTEEEWEYAARGTDGRTYPWGNAAPSGSLLNSLGPECVTMGERLGRSGWKPMYGDSDGWESTAPVGGYSAGASPFGVLDMAGNVWEWTSSGYSQDYHSERSDEKHVIRGGAWGFGDPSFVRTTNRGKSPPVYRGADLGFRCATAPAASR
jgi:formylglycine-generating enzyme required for sulfatase activity